MRQHPDETNGANGGAAITEERPATLAGLPCPSHDRSPIMPLLLTEAQAAEVLSLSPRKVWELAACGAIPCVKIGAVKRYRRIDLEAWVLRGCPTAPQK